MQIAFFGSSLVSAYWNGAATYYRGILKALHARGHSITFYEPDAYDRQSHVDHPDPPYARSVVYANTDAAMQDAIREADDFADVVVKASGVGVMDAELEAAVAGMTRPGRACVFWDVDAPATLARMDGDAADPFRPLVPEYDAILTYGGGPPVVSAYERLHAKRCVPVYNAVDPDTHHPADPDPRFDYDLVLLANRLPDREARINTFFFDAARRLSDRRFAIGGSGWHEGVNLPANVAALGHISPPEHNAFNCTPLTTLNVNRDSMAAVGWSPATRVFEAAGAGACLITDEWKGINEFLQPDTEVLVASDGEAVADHLASLTKEKASAIGDAAHKRVLREHTYAHRAGLAEEVLQAARRPS